MYRQTYTVNKNILEDSPEVDHTFSDKSQNYFPIEKHKHNFEMYSSLDNSKKKMVTILDL